MKDENSFLLITTLIIAIVASIFCASEWFNGNQETALVLTAGSVVALSFYVVAISLRQIKNNATVLEEKLSQLEEKIEQIEKQEEVYVQVPIEH